MPASKVIIVKHSQLHSTLAHPQGIPRGFLRLYVLKRIAVRPAHGYDLLQEIESKTEGVWRPGAGSIYPILKELVKGGYIRAESHEKTGKSQRIYHITSEGRALLQQSGEMLLKTGQNWGAMRSIIIELVDPKNIPTMFTHMTAGQFAFLRGILETKRDKIPRKEIQFMLKEYALNLERQLDWTRRILKKS
ncbi:MAG TPA: PadR family transcriptional regulator [Candidatus Bathyarchaeia archaeon]|nr:PadR family transcriptional regulator [Candidatus Bathyarchaeia archaeon]